MGVKTNRISWIDNIKFLAMWCVIFGHFNGLIFTHGRPGFAFINLLIVVFNMPLFVFMSGFSNYSSLNKVTNIISLLSYLIRQIERIALPCIIPSILVFFINPNAEYVNFKSFWFLVTLFILQVSVGIIFYIVKMFKFPSYVCWGLFIILMFVINRYLTSELCIFYLLGGLMRQYELKNKLSLLFYSGNRRREIMIYVLFFLVALLLFAFVRNYQIYNYTFYTLLDCGKIYIWFLRNLCACLIIYCIIGIVKSSSNRYNLISYMGSKTLGLYIWTSILIDVCLRYNITLNGDTVYSWFTTVFVSVLATFLALGIICLLERNKITEYLFFGKR